MPSFRIYVNPYIFGQRTGKQTILHPTIAFPYFHLLLIFYWMEFWFFKVVPKYLICSTPSKHLSYIFILWFVLHSDLGIEWLISDYLNTFHNPYLLTYLLTYSMVQSPSWEANWFAACQEIPRISRNPKVHYCTHKRPPPVPILGQSIYPHPTSWRSILILSTHLRLGLPRNTFHNTDKKYQEGRRQWPRWNEYVSRKGPTAYITK